MSMKPGQRYGDIGPGDGSFVEGREGGRVRRDPVSFTLEKREAFVSLVAGGETKVQACRTIGIAFNTYNRAYKASEEFREAVDTADRESWDIAVQKLREAVRDGEPWAIQYVLKGHRGLSREWDGDVQRVQVQVEGAVDVRGVEGLEQMARELAERRRELEGLGVLEVQGAEAIGDRMGIGDGDGEAGGHL